MTVIDVAKVPVNGTRGSSGTGSGRRLFLGRFGCAASSECGRSQHPRRNGRATDLSLDVFLNERSSFRKATAV